MITNLKALLVVMALALAVFHIAKPICLQFMAEADFSRRRKVWLALTVTAFVSPSFWIYAFVAFAVLLWAGKKENNPIALYALLLHVIPPVNVELPAIIVNRLFDLNNFRILALAVLIPKAWQLMHAKDKSAFGNHKKIDQFMWAYFFLQLILQMPYEDLTNTFRRGLLLVLDSLVVFYVVSRTCNSRQTIGEVVATFCLGFALMVPVAVFESQKVWLLYTGVADTWDVSMVASYLFRGDSLRAQASAGHSLVLGYFLSMGFGLWLYISSKNQITKKHYFGMVFFWMGLLAAYSRAPWLTAIFAYCIFVVMSPNGAKKIIKVAIFASVGAGVLLLLPIGQRIIDTLPFIGTVDASNVDYRKRLADASWSLIAQNPFFGDPFFEEHLESMRQGQGIIDLVNTYASTAMLNGCIGLLLFVGPITIAIINSWSVVRMSRGVDSDLQMLGAALIACMLGTSVFLATCSFYIGIPIVYYLIIGLASGYGQLRPTKVEEARSVMSGGVGLRYQKS